MKNSFKTLIDWLGDSGICVIFAPPRTGKTALLTAIANEFAFNRDRFKKMKDQIKLLNAGDFNLSYGQHCVYSNYNITFKKFRHSRRKSYLFNPFKFGFFNKNVKTQFFRPCSVLAITEGQKYLNSRKSKNYPAWQSRSYEQIGHNEILALIDVQRPMLIDANIRELSKFIEVLSLKKIVKNRKIVKMIWQLRLIDNSFLLDKYLASGKELKVPEIEVSISYNVFNLYNSKCCQPKFFEGHLNQDFDLFVGKNFEFTKESFSNYLKNLDDELPEGFYEK